MSTNRENRNLQILRVYRGDELKNNSPKPHNAQFDEHIIWQSMYYYFFNNNIVINISIVAERLTGSIYFHEYYRSVRFR